MKENALARSLFTYEDNVMLHVDPFHNYVRLCTCSLKMTKVFESLPELEPATCTDLCKVVDEAVPENTGTLNPRGLLLHEARERFLPPEISIGAFHQYGINIF